MKRACLCFVAGLLAYTATGVYVVQPDQQVVVRRYGRMVGAAREPGLQFGLPWGLERRDWLRTREVKRLSIGSIPLADDAVGSAPDQFLTGDRNLVRVRATVHYTIRDPGQYLFQIASVDPLVAQAGEATLTNVLGGQPVDRALTLGKQQLGLVARDRLQHLVDRYELGISIRSVDMGMVAPPPDVADAFDDVVRALREREQQMNQAHSFASRTQAQAQADAQRIIDESRAFRDRALREAQGEAVRFEKLLAEYLRSPQLTARRLYLETMAYALPKSRSKLIIDSGAELDLSILREENP